MRRIAVLVVGLVTLAGLAACTSGSSSSPPTTAAPDAEPVELVAVGDIADCDAQHDEAVADVVAELPGPVLLLGDIAYPDGSEDAFTRCHDPRWTAFADRVRPAPGNHEYYTKDAEPYYRRFDDAGAAGEGWYSFDVGAWHMIALNSNCAAVGGCGAGSAQEKWLREDLEEHAAVRCTMAFWHHPRFSSGSTHGSDAVTGALWRALVDAEADVVLSGHEHVYERLAPLDAGGGIDPVGGIRSFVVGTGGRYLYDFGVPIAGSEVREDDAFGVLRLRLWPDRYAWEFVAAAGSTFSDRGQARCH